MPSPPTKMRGPSLACCWRGVAAWKKWARSSAVSRSISSSLSVRRVVMRPPRGGTIAHGGSIDDDPALATRRPRADRPRSRGAGGPRPHPAPRASVRRPQVPLPRAAGRQPGARARADRALEPLRDQLRLVLEPREPPPGRRGDGHRGGGNLPAGRRPDPGRPHDGRDRPRPAGAPARRPGDRAPRRHGRGLLHGADAPAGPGRRGRGRARPRDRPRRRRRRRGHRGAGGADRRDRVLVALDARGAEVPAGGGPRRAWRPAPRS